MFIHPELWTWTKLCSCIGSICFVISDTLLGFHYFHSPLPYSQAPSTNAPARRGDGGRIAGVRGGREANAYIHALSDPFPGDDGDDDWSTLHATVAGVAARLDPRAHGPAIAMTMIANQAAIGVRKGVVYITGAMRRRGEAIICYQCNSEYDPRCGDPLDTYTLGTVNCSFQPRLEHLSHLEPTLCRKISQKVYGKERVVRSCGYITDAEKDNGECLMKTGTHDVRAIYCSCTGDLCNSVESLRTPSLLPLASLLTAVLATPSLLLSCPIVPSRISLSAA
ncbi:hypothetical protein ALC60_08573 [Trachymyrmex zeteki]|uniref:Uncharacterized protein n=1 Tax=Mycetomoellerius zeteki TaxID=64791 RepID=A0A151WX20_9HYME|nr:hypothetical protein ALC60_08573 [Trachymyrmex zeteki]